MTDTHATTRPRSVTTALATLAVGLTLGLAACGGSPAGSPGTDRPASTATSPSAGSSMPDGVDEADVVFVQGMLPHHQQAVTMSDTLLAKDGIGAGTTALAGQVKAAQQPEIDTMNGWLTAWGQGAGGGMGGMDHGMGDGMADQAELTQLDQARGADAERLYLTLMTRHHEGAVAMAETEIRDGRDPDAIRLARSVVSTQQAEIATMKQLLAEL